MLLPMMVTCWPHHVLDHTWTVIWAELWRKDDWNTPAEEMWDSWIAAASSSRWFRLARYVKSKLLNCPGTEGAALLSRKPRDVPRSLSVILASEVIEPLLWCFWPSGCFLALCLPILLKQESRKMTKTWNLIPECPGGLQMSLKWLSRLLTVCWPCQRGPKSGAIGSSPFSLHFGVLLTWRAFSLKINQWSLYFHI